MKFINSNELNKLHDDFEKAHGNNEDFQSYVEKAKDDEKPICLETEEIREALERIHDDDYTYLLECNDEDLEFYGEDYLRRINFFGKLLDGKGELTTKDIKEDRRCCEDEHD